MYVRKVDAVELVALANFDASMDYYSFEDANVIVTYSCKCGRCVN